MVSVSFYDWTAASIKWGTPSKNDLLQTLVEWWQCASAHFLGWLIQLYFGWVCFFAIKAISLNCICFDRPRGISHLNFKCSYHLENRTQSQCARRSHRWTPLKRNNIWVRCKLWMCTRTAMNQVMTKYDTKRQTHFSNGFCCACAVVIVLWVCVFLVCVSSFITSFNRWLIVRAQRGKRKSQCSEYGYGLKQTLGKRQ